MDCNISIDGDDFSIVSLGERGQAVYKQENPATAMLMV